MEGLKDAIRRLNLLIGVLSVAHDGASIRWWSMLTHGTGIAGMFKLGEQPIDDLFASVAALREEEVRKAVTAAMFWIREPRNMLEEGYRSEDLATFAGYWNAFECLVAAINILRPLHKVPRDEKNELVRKRLKDAGESVDVATISALYHEVVNPGLRSQAEHAIRLCCGVGAEESIAECFTTVPKEDQLYEIRNSIDHGTIDVNDLDTTLRVETRFRPLRELVAAMLGGTFRIGLSSPTEK